MQENLKLFEQISLKSEKLKLTESKAREALQKVRCWINKEFGKSEPLPPEFRNLNIHSDCEQTRSTWQKRF